MARAMTSALSPERVRFRITIAVHRAQNSGPISPASVTARPSAPGRSVRAARRYGGRRGTTAEPTEHRRQEREREEDHGGEGDHGRDRALEEDPERALGHDEALPEG